MIETTDRDQFDARVAGSQAASPLVTRLDRGAEYKPTADTDAGLRRTLGVDRTAS